MRVAAKVNNGVLTVEDGKSVIFLPTRSIDYFERTGNTVYISHGTEFTKLRNLEKVMCDELVRDLVIWCAPREVEESKTKVILKNDQDKAAVP